MQSMRQPLITRLRADLDALARLAKTAAAANSYCLCLNGVPQNVFHPNSPYVTTSDVSIVDEISWMSAKLGRTLQQRMNDRNSDQFYTLEHLAYVVSRLGIQTQQQLDWLVGLSWRPISEYDQMDPLARDMIQGKVLFRLGGHISGLKYGNSDPVLSLTRTCGLRVATHFRVMELS